MSPKNPLHHSIKLQAQSLGQQKKNTQSISCWYCLNNSLQENFLNSLGFQLLSQCHTRSAIYLKELVRVRKGHS